MMKYERLSRMTIGMKTDETKWMTTATCAAPYLPFKTFATPLRSHPEKSLWDLRTRPQTSLKITQKELSEHSTTSSLWLSIGGVVPCQQFDAICFKNLQSQLLHKRLNNHLMQVQNMQMKQFHSSHDSSLSHAAP